MDVNERYNMPLEDILDQVLLQMESVGYTPGGIANYKHRLNSLLSLAQKLGLVHYDQELAQVFLDDQEFKESHTEGSRYETERAQKNVRIIRMIESFLETGVIDCSVTPQLREKPFKSEALCNCFEEYEEYLGNSGLKQNTTEGYSRIVRYFLSYLENRGYSKLNEVKSGDILFFITVVTKEHYSPISLGSVMSGLKQFVCNSEELRKYEDEIPKKIPKSRTITPYYSEEEHERIESILASSQLSARDRAIALLAFNTGLRAVDIVGLTYDSVDWEHDVISIIQEKTDVPLQIPLEANIGNALLTYILDERPDSSDPHIFISNFAPFKPLSSHAGVYNILQNVLKEAKVEPNGRITGTRMTRHSFASRLLRKGVSLDVIQDSLGHTSPDSSMRYLSTNEEVMRTLTLPLP